MAKIFTAENAEDAEGRCFFSVLSVFSVVFRTIPEDNKKSLSYEITIRHRPRIASQGQGHQRICPFILLLLFCLILRYL